VDLVKPIETSGQCTNMWLGVTRRWDRRGFWTERGAQRWVSRQFKWSRTPPSALRQKRAERRGLALRVAIGALALAGLLWLWL
jgi:hypothetical protein